MPKMKVVRKGNYVYVLNEKGERMATLNKKTGSMFGATAYFGPLTEIQYGAKTSHIILTRKKGTKQKFSKAGPYRFRSKKDAMQGAKRSLGAELKYYDVKTKKVNKPPTW